MKESAQVSGADKEIGSWAKSIFEVIDSLIQHDVSDSNFVFAIGFGADSKHVQVFDILSTLDEITEEKKYILDRADEANNGI